MSKSTIVTVDDDPAVSQAIARDLRARYGEDFRIVRATSGADALEAMRELASRRETVALIISDQRMPEMSGTEFLDQARALAPGAKLLLLTAYADTTVAINAINEIGLDYYLLKPWDPPEEKLYPVIDDLLGDWRKAHPEDDPVVRIIGHRWSERSHEIKTFLARNHVPYKWFDIDRDAEPAPRRDPDAPVVEYPVVMIPDGATLRGPSTLDIAAALGLRTQADQPLYDLCIVGGGPAGLAAAVYAASEGLQTVIVEREAPGGQAGQSASIENYLGFPKGLSGADLTHRAVAQATRFGAEMVLAREVDSLEHRGQVHCVRFADGGEIEARTVLISTGVSYRRLEGAGIEDFTGRGLYYGATASEAAQCEGADVYVVGAANSAGQAVLNLAKHANRVTMIVRAADLESGMSQYLVDRIRATPNVEVRLRSEVVAGTGDERLESITIEHRDTGVRGTVATNWLYVFIGAAPRTEFLGDDVARDRHGFIVTGTDLLEMGGSAWTLSRSPLPLETSVPGVFAAGDVRLDSMKRVAAAVGEGAMSVYLIHRYLATV